MPYRPLIAHPLLMIATGLFTILALSCGGGGGSSSSSPPSPSPSPSRSSNSARPAVNFTSSFEAEQGTSSSAITDGHQWDDILGFQNQLLTIVGPENGVNPVNGISMLRISLDHEENGGIVSRDAIDLTANNIYLRFYVNHQCIEDDIAFTHYVQDCDTQLGLCDSSNFYWVTANYSASTGRYRVGWQTYADQRGPGSGCNGDGLFLNDVVTSWGTIQEASPAIEEANDPNGLECGRWYRVEIRVACLEPGCMNHDRDDEVATRLHMRVYDDGGQQIIGDAQMRSMSLGGVWQAGTPGISMEEAYSARSSGGMDSCYYLSSGRPSLHFGNNGQQGTRALAEAFMYFDSIATSAVSWIGP